MKMQLTKEEILLRERMRTLSSGITDYKMNNDKILFTKGTSLFLFSIETNEIIDLTENNLTIEFPKSSKMDAKFSPDGKYISYICNDCDIFIMNLETLKETRLTKSENGKRSGVAEFIMQEEFDRFTGYWWNITDKGVYQILYIEIDESKVPILKISESGMSRDCEEYKYPRLGDNNVISKLNLISFKNEFNIDIKDLEEMNKLGEDFEYITRVGWESKSSFWVEYLTREQTLKRIYSQNEEKAIVKCIHEEKVSSTSWINISNLKVFNNEKRIIGSESSDGYMHLFMIEKNGNIHQLTKGEYVVKDVWWNIKDDIIYFTSNMDTVLETHLYSLKSNEIKRITKLGYNYSSFSFNSDYSSVSCTYSSLNQFPISLVLSLDRENDEWIEGDIIDFQIEKLDVNTLNLIKPTIFNFKNKSNDIIYGTIFQQETKEKTPTMLYIYQGPHVQLVKNDYSLYSNGRLQILTSLGYNVVIIDGRGSFGRGLKFEGILKYKMGQVELEDQMEGLNYLIENSNVDKDRIGIHGWSYGGYMSLMALCQYPNYFKIGIAGAPVTQWELYDTGYTERYLGIPSLNEDAYKLGSVLNYSSNFPEQEDRLFIIHGSSDENVHFKHTEVLITDLIKKGKPFKLGYYPGERHGLRQFNSTLYYYKELIKFISKNL